MLVILQFPFADVRAFVPGETHRLALPDWTAPLPDADFLRSFGAIRRRRSEWLTGWAAEDYVCIAERALRIPYTKESNRLFDTWGWRRLSHTFCVDDLGVARFQLAIAHKPGSERRTSVADVLRALLDVPVEIPNGRGGVVRTRMHRAGRYLAALYLHSSTTVSPESASAVDEWWVKPGRAGVVIEQMGHVQGVGLKHLPPDLSSVYGINVARFEFAHAGLTYDAWAYRAEAADEETRTALRKLRMALLRLHATDQALLQVLRLIDKGDLPSAMPAANTKALHRYLHLAEQRVRRCGRRSGITAAALAGAIAGEDAPAARPLLLNGMGPNLGKEVALSLARARWMAAGETFALNGAQMGMLRDALLGAFSQSELRELLLLHMDVKLEDEVKASPYRDVALELIEWAGRRGRLDELIWVAAEERPSSADLQVFRSLLSSI